MRCMPQENRFLKSKCKDEKNLIKIQKHRIIEIIAINHFFLMRYTLFDRVNNRIKINFLLKNNDFYLVWLTKNEYICEVIILKT